MLSHVQAMSSNNMQFVVGPTSRVPSKIPKARSRSGSNAGPLGADEETMKQNRHARRLYVGSIPQNYANEDLLTRFLNYAICLGLNDDPEASGYILSVYMNPKKYFAFVELSSVELTTACLELDGILFYGNALKIQRADEYKPDLLSHTYRPQPLRLDLSKIPFFSAQQPPSPPGETPFSQLSTLIKDAATYYTMEPGSLAIIGFPYDENIRHGNNTRNGCGSAPKIVRKWIRKIGSVSNPETESDLSHLTIVDKGDIPLGLSHKDAQLRLTDAITGVIYQGSIPIIVGGSNDISYCCASALLAVAGGNVGILSVDAYLNVESLILPEERKPYDSSFRKLFDDRRFCPARDGLGSMPTCDGRFIAFGAQGMLCSNENARYVTDRGGNIVWLGKDIRTKAIRSNVTVGDQFKLVLGRLGEGNSFNLTGSRRPVCVCIHMRAVNGVVCPGVSTPSTVGFQADEILEICFLAGSNPNVAMLAIADFNPDIEENQTGHLVADMVQQFLLGVSKRFTIPVPGSTGGSTTVSASSSSSSSLRSPLGLQQFGAVVSSSSSLNSLAMGSGSAASMSNTNTGTLGLSLNLGSFSSAPSLNTGLSQSLGLHTSGSLTTLSGFPALGSSPTNPLTLTSLNVDSISNASSSFHNSVSMSPIGSPNINRQGSGNLSEHRGSAVFSSNSLLADLVANNSGLSSLSDLNIASGSISTSGSVSPTERPASTVLSSSESVHSFTSLNMNMNMQSSSLTGVAAVGVDGGSHSSYHHGNEMESDLDLNDTMSMAQLQQEFLALSTSSGQKDTHSNNNNKNNNANSTSSYLQYSLQPEVEPF